MKFIINNTGVLEDKVLTYSMEDFSFDMEPLDNVIDYDIVINTLNLSVVKNKVVQIWGFSSIENAIKTNKQVPMAKKGELMILDNLEGGFSYRINQEEWPILINNETGWICMGNPDKTYNAIEFIHNCIAVIDENHNFIALWLNAKIV